MNFINIAETKLRAGNARCCACCGRPLRPKRGSRQQRYCSYRCRDEVRRARNFAGSYPNQAIPRSVENRPLISKVCKGDLADLAYSIIGPRDVIKTELITSHDWRPIVSPDGVRFEVAGWSVP